MVSTRHAMQVIVVCVVLLIVTHAHSWTSEVEVEILKQVFRYSGHLKHVVIIKDLNIGLRVQAKDDVKLLSKDLISVVVADVNELKHLQNVQGVLSSSLIVFPTYYTDDLHLYLYELRKVIRFSGPTWLLFMRADMTLDAILSDVDIPFDCEFFVVHDMRDKQEPGEEEVLITEVYRIAPGLPLQTSRFASWNERDGFRGTNRSLYYRRANLQGLQLRAVTVQKPPLCYMEELATGNKLKGYITDFWEALEQNINFTFKLKKPKPGSKAYKNGNGTFDVVIAMLINNEVDLAPVAIDLTGTYQDVIDFAVPSYSAIFKVFLRETFVEDVLLSDVLTPFSTTLWFVVLLSVIASSTVLTLVYQHGRDHPVTFSDAIFYLFGAILCQQGTSLAPRAASCRIVLVIAHVCGIVLISSYSSFLVSNRAIVKPHVPFTTLEGLYEDGTYDLEAVTTDTALKYFVEAEDGILQKLYEVNMGSGRNYQPTSVLEGFHRLCWDYKHAFISTEKMFSIMQKQLPCKIVHLPNVFKMSSGSIAIYPKHSPYRGLLNFYTLRLAAGGAQMNIFKNLAKKRLPNTQPAVSPITMETDMPIFAILFYGFVVAIVLLAIEITMFEK